MPGQLQYWLRNSSHWFWSCLLVIACTGPAKEDTEQAKSKSQSGPNHLHRRASNLFKRLAKPEDLGITPGFWKPACECFRG